MWSVDSGSERRNYLEVTPFHCLFLNQGQCTSISQEPSIGLVPFLDALTTYLTGSSLREQRPILAPGSISVHHGCQTKSIVNRLDSGYIIKLGQTK